MAMTPEAKVKKVVVKHLKSMGAYYFYPVTGGWGGSGVPDIVGCYKGKFFGIECKAGKNKTTPLVINEENMNDVGAILEGVNAVHNIPDPWSQWHEA